MYLPTLILFLATSFFNGTPAKEYIREVNDAGKITAEGWVENGMKSGYWKFYFSNSQLKQEGTFKDGVRQNYWYFYHPNGQQKQEGHFNQGQRIDWWIYYNKKGHLIHKCQLNDGLKDGYCLMYKNNKLTAAQKFSKGAKIKEWKDLQAFKKENNLSDLY